MARITSASTGRTAADARLRGRTYGIPFEDVWQGALRLAGGELRGWSVEHADDQEGIVNARVASRLKSLHGIVEIRISLDANAQTRVDGHAATPDAFHDFGANARRLHRFFSALDREATKERERRRGLSLAAS